MKSSEVGEFLHHFLVQKGFNSFPKNKSTRDKTAISSLKENNTCITPANEQKFVKLESINESWGSDETFDDYDTYDLNNYEQEVEQSSYRIIFLSKSRFFSKSR